MLPGKRVRLRPIERDDLPRFVEWFADPEVRVNLLLYKPMGLAQEEAWFEDNVSAGDTQAWAIDASASPRDPAAWVHVGSCGFHHIDWRCRSGEIGIVIGKKEAWGQGYGTDATDTLLRWGFETLGLHRIWLRVFADNARAIRCYEKVGFRHEGRLREDSFRGGAFGDTLVMGILSREWKQPV
jgi:RimJ/RimL family protein N-acetyltransferase